MKIWCNTKTLDGYISTQDLDFEPDPSLAEVALIGGKAIELQDMPRLKGIFKTGVGRDNVPEKDARAKNIQCGFPSERTAEIIYDETASFACYLVLKCLYINSGNFAKWQKDSRASLANKTVLIIGNGNIGSRVAQRLNNLLQIETYDEQVNSESELSALLRRADCVSLHTPLTQATQGWFDKSKLSKLKDGAALVNTARGAIVNEQDLYNELKQNRIIAAFDVFWSEPYSGKLLDFADKSFFATPHVASTCREFLQSTADDFLRFLDALERN